MLASAYSTDDVVTHATGLLARTLAPAHATLFLRDGEGRFASRGRDRQPVEAALPPDLTRRAAAGRVLARYEWDDGSRRALPPL